VTLKFQEGAVILRDSGFVQQSNQRRPQEASCLVRLSFIKIHSHSDKLPIITVAGYLGVRVASYFRSITVPITNLV